MMVLSGIDGGVLDDERGSGSVLALQGSKYVLSMNTVLKR